LTLWRVYTTRAFIDVCWPAYARSNHANFIDLGSLIREFFRQFTQVVPRHLAQDNP